MQRHNISFFLIVIDFFQENYIINNNLYVIGLMGLEVIFMKLSVFMKMIYLSSVKNNLKSFHPLRPELELKIEEK